MKYGLFMVLIWCTVMLPFSLMLALWGDPTDKNLWQFVGLL